MNLKRLVQLLFVIVLVSCTGNETDSAMGINWQTPENWGIRESGQNPEGSFVGVEYYFLDNSYNNFVAQRFPTQYGMKRHKEDEITSFREIMQDDRIVYVEKSNEYQMTICGQDAVVLERLFRPNKTAVSASYDVSAIDIWFTMDNTLYSISLLSNERDEGISADRIEQFWNMIENIECPSED